GAGRKARGRLHGRTREMALSIRVGCGEAKVEDSVTVANGSTLDAYPRSPSARNRWVLQRRGPKNLLDPRRAYAAFFEEEIGPAGDLISNATLLLTHNESHMRRVTSH